MIPFRIYVVVLISWYAMVGILSCALYRNQNSTHQRAVMAFAWTDPPPVIGGSNNNNHKSFRTIPCFSSSSSTIRHDAHRRKHMMMLMKEHAYSNSAVVPPTTSMVVGEATTSGDNICCIDRRKAAGMSAAAAMIIMMSFRPSTAGAIGFLPGGDSDTNRRQLELCLVAVLRVLYWAQSQLVVMVQQQPSSSFTTTTTMEMTDNIQQQQLLQKVYLESRLGAKAILTGKVGPGATYKVYTLSTLQIPNCLTDMEWHMGHRQKDTATSKDNRQMAVRRVSDLRRDFTEGLASIVEFDGFDTLVDPSPRSSLTLSQYNPQKLQFIQRTFQEIVLPTGYRLITSFGSEPIQRSIRYTQQYYSDEIPSNNLGLLSPLFL